MKLNIKKYLSFLVLAACCNNNCFCQDSKTTDKAIFINTCSRVFECVKFMPKIGGLWFGLCISLAFHEFGHFLAAKLADRKITKFSVGIGQNIFTIENIEKNTTWTLSVIPLLGHVNTSLETIKYIGISDPKNKKLDEHISEILKSMIIYIAGPIFNLIFSAIVLSFVHGSAKYNNKIDKAVILETMKAAVKTIYNLSCSCFKDIGGLFILTRADAFIEFEKEVKSILNNKSWISIIAYLVAFWSIYYGWINIFPILGGDGGWIACCLVDIMKFLCNKTFINKFIDTENGIGLINYQNGGWSVYNKICYSLFIIGYIKAIYRWLRYLVDFLRSQK